MMYSEFAEAVGCKDNDHNHKVFRELEIIYMNSDMSKAEIYEYGKKLVDNSKSEKELKVEAEVKADRVLKRRITKMTNAEIIFQNRVFLMEHGVIQGIPGTSVTVKDEQGEREVLMPEEIHTYNAWKKLGYQVQKGQHAVAKFPVWKFRTNRKQEQEADEEQEVSGRCFMKVAFFFTMGQVAPIKQEVEA